MSNTLFCTPETHNKNKLINLKKKKTTIPQPSYLGKLQTRASEW